LSRRERVSAQDRDRRLEARYKPCADGCCRSLLQRIGYHAEDLVNSYMRWASAERLDKFIDSEEILRWEVDYFGEQPYAAAHGLMVSLIKQRILSHSKRRSQEHEKSRT